MVENKYLVPQNKVLFLRLPEMGAKCSMGFWVQSLKKFLISGSFYVRFPTIESSWYSWR